MNHIPKELSEKILADVHSRLHPQLGYLIGKIFLIHIATAVVTLSVCPQFGFKVLKLPVNLMNSFMVLGMPACNFLCGLFFTATSVVVGAFVLKRDELRALRFQKMLVSAFLILSSAGFFGIMNPHLFLEFSLLWLLGAFTGVAFTLEVSSRILSRV